MNTAIRRLLGEVCAPVRAPASVCEPFARWRDDPEGFVRHHTGERPWAAQRAAWEELYGHHRMTWRGPRKCGKSRWLEWTVCHFLATRPSVVLTISASWHQVRNVIWSGVAELHARAAARGTPLPGRVDATQWRLGPRHFALGRATDDPNRIQGFHSASPVPEDLDPDAVITEDEVDTILARAREAGDVGVDLLALCDELVEPRIVDAIAGSIQGPNAYWALTFNPTIESGSAHPYARSFTDPGPWRRIAVHPEEVDDPVGADRRFTSIPILLQRPAWREEMAHQWPIDSAPYRAYVLGLFAAAGSDRMLISEALLLSTERRADDDGIDRSWLGTHVGIDLSRSSGGDECVASRWAHGTKTAEYVWRAPDAMRSVEVVEALIRRWGEPDPFTGEIAPLPGHHVHVDATGLGGPIVDRLRQKGVWVDAVDFGSPPAYEWTSLVGETRFANRRAEMHWVYRRAFEEGLAYLPREYRDSWGQALWPQWEPKIRAGETVIAIEPKEKIVDRMGRSPDHMDADVLAWCRTGGGITIERWV